MPYCCQCGKPISPADSFCGLCGAKQTGPPGSTAGATVGLSPRSASTLCYLPLLGWIPAIFVLASGKFRENATARFHAFQGIYLFVAWLLVDWVMGASSGLSFLHEFHIRPLFHMAFIISLLKLLLWIAWIFMIVKTNRGEVYKLPLIGDLAEKSVSEQKKQA